ncbi:GAF domain-containing protein [Pendulispora albinea]|uniref:GAF domain-containing protein n=1 Tax=Pendulispora albinea TaxID=2741071 RepID=A0ABZ2M549_9BACT
MAAHCLVAWRLSGSTRGLIFFAGAVFAVDVCPSTIRTYTFFAISYRPMDLLSQLESAGSNLDEALRAVLRHFQAQIGTIHILQDDGMLHLAASTPGIPEPVLAASRCIPVGKGIAGLAVQRKAPVNMCNLQTDTSGDARPGARATGAMGSLCVPLLRGEDAVGALGIAVLGERTFGPEDEDALLEAGRVLARLDHPGVREKGQPGGPPPT